MPDASQFTPGLFDNTALGWTVETPTVDMPLSSTPAPDDEDDATTLGSDKLPAAPNFYLTADRALARGWPARARDNLHAILYQSA